MKHRRKKRKKKNNNCWCRKLHPKWSTTHCSNCGREIK